MHLLPKMAGMRERAGRWDERGRVLRTRNRRSLEPMDRAPQFRGRLQILIGVELGATAAVCEPSSTVQFAPVERGMQTNSKFITDVVPCGRREAAGFFFKLKFRIPSSRSSRCCTLPYQVCNGQPTLCGQTAVRWLFSEGPAGRVHVHAPLRMSHCILIGVSTG